jgi:hypothetical protein
VDRDVRPCRVSPFVHYVGGSGVSATRGHDRGLQHRVFRRGGSGEPMNATGLQRYTRRTGTTTCSPLCSSSRAGRCTAPEPPTPWTCRGPEPVTRNATPPSKQAGAWGAAGLAQRCRTPRVKALCRNGRLAAGAPVCRTCRGVEQGRRRLHRVVVADALTAWPLVGRCFAQAVGSKGHAAALSPIETCADLTETRLSRTGRGLGPVASNGRGSVGSEVTLAKSPI